MRIGHRQLFWLGTALLLIGAAFLIFPPYSAYCEGDQPSDYYCAAYGVTLLLGGFVETYNGAFTALATIAVAAFTWTLWQSNEKMWKITRVATRATMRSAEAAQGASKTAEKAFTLLERPRVLPLKVSPISEAVLVNGAIARFITFSIGNYGKVPALVHRVTASFHLIEIPLTTEKLLLSWSRLFEQIFRVVKWSLCRG